MTGTRTNAIRWPTVVATVVLLGVLTWYLGQPGYRHTRLLLFAAIGGFAVVGAVGVVFDFERLIVVGAVGLLVLGFWQAVLWLYVYPVVGLLVLSFLVGNDEEN
ncbi:hypothetical protein [Haladaptatus sp. NG-SE-30]